MRELGALLRSWRHRALMTQEQLAERAGLNVRTIRRYESGHVAGRPQNVSIRLLVAALGLDAQEQSLLVDATRSQPSRVAAADGANVVPRAGPTGGPAATLAMRQLPAAPPLFTGRTRELTQIERVSDPAKLVIVTIDGMAGVGKTAFVREAAHRVAARYPDGQIHLELHGCAPGASPVEPAEALERILRSIGVPAERVPAQLDDRAALYRSELAGRRILIVLDNAAEETQVAPLLPGTPGCLVLITSRRRLTGLEHTHALSLDLLPHADALELFTRAAGPGRFAEDSGESLAEIVGRCAGLPLALQIAAARLRSHPSWSAEHLLRCLRDGRHRLAELEVGQRSVAVALDLSYLQLGPEQRHAYRILSLHPGCDIDADAAVALIGLSTIRAQRLIDHLLDVHLLQEPAAGRYRFHDLIRCHAANRAERDATGVERSAALDRLLDHYALAARHPCPTQCG